MQALPAKRLIPLLLLVFLVFVSACADQTTQVITPPSTDPSALSAMIAITDTLQSQSADVTVKLTVKSDPSQILQLNAQESLSCDNVALKWNTDNEDYEAHVSQQQAGSAYTITYTYYGKHASITISVPQAPTFTSPIKDTRVPRSAKLTVIYQAQSASQVQIDASDDAGKFIPGSSVKNTGSASLDTSSLAEGLGTLRLVATYNIKSESVDFSPVPVNYQMIVGTSVIWV
jgi:outer membrane lipoprotein-sorting protein